MTDEAGDHFIHRRPLDPGDLITESEAYVLYGRVLQDKELRHARKTGRIGYVRRKRTIFYRRDELAAFVDAVLAEEYVQPCRT